MKEEQKKRFLKKILYRLGSVILLIVIIFFIGKVWHSYGEFSRTRGEAGDLRAEIEDLRERKKELLFEVERLQTTRGMEEEIRSRFNAVREGEELVIIVDSAESPLSGEAETKGGFWSKIRGWFGR